MLSRYRMLAGAGALTLIAALWMPAVAVAEDENGSSGEELFTAKGCGGCHGFGEEKVMGPDLAGLAERRSDEFILLELTDPAANRETDSVAAELAARFPVPMPATGMSEEDAAAILEFLKGK